MALPLFPSPPFPHPPVTLLIPLSPSKLPPYSAAAILLSSCCQTQALFYRKPFLRCPHCPTPSPPQPLVSIAVLLYLCVPFVSSHFPEWEATFSEPLLDLFHAVFLAWHVVGISKCSGLELTSSRGEGNQQVKIDLLCWELNPGPCAC